MQGEASSWLSLGLANQAGGQQNVAAALAQINWRLGRNISVGKCRRPNGRAVALRLATRHAALDWPAPKLGLTPRLPWPPPLAPFVQCGPITHSDR